MRFSHVFLAAFLMMSCNDEKKNDKIMKVEDLAKDEKKEDCSIKLVKECLLGNWKIKSAKLGEKGQTLVDLTLTDPQKDQSLSITDGKISGKILLVKADAIELGANVSEITQTTYSFEEGSKKITFNGPSGSPLNLIVKAFKDKEMTLELSGVTTGSPAKNHVLETVWIKE